ncbi:50S ribosomal protein L4 [Verrucomicrobiota bacterium]
MKLTVTDINGKGVGELELSDELFVAEKGSQAAFEAVVATRAAARAGTASTKTKGEVKATGAKPWKQKGLGRARAGYRSSPVWRGGGVAFGPKPRSYAKKMNKRVARLAFANAFSSAVAEGTVKVIDELKLEAPKTKEFAAVLKNLEIARGALFVTADKNDNAVLAARNISRVEVTTADLVNTYELVKFPQIVLTQAAVEKLAARLA